MARPASSVLLPSGEPVEHLVIVHLKPELEITCGRVVEDPITRDIVECFFGGEVSSRFADDSRQLGLVIDLFCGTGVVRYWLFVTDERSREFQEHEQPLGHLDV